MTTTASVDDAALLREAAEAMAQLRRAVASVIVGQDAAVEALLAAVLAEGHCLIVGVPGLAKTLLARTLADALGWRFKRIQFTPDMMPADVIGVEMLHEDAGGGRTMRFAPGPIFANFLLADEINRTPPKTQSALLEAMQEYTVTSLGRSHPLERPFIVAATQNPIEQEGTYPLPEAQLDRFMVGLWLDYPSRADEERIVAATTVPPGPRVEPVLNAQRWRSYAELTRRVPASSHVVKYAVALARATRPGDENADEFVRQYVHWGVGPRGAQHLVLLAKALAVLAGEPVVHAGHVRRAAPLVFRHRLLVNYHALGDGIDAAAIVGDVLKHVAE